MNSTFNLLDEQSTVAFVQSKSEVGWQFSSRETWKILQRIWLITNYSSIDIANTNKVCNFPCFTFICKSQHSHCNVQQSVNRQILWYVSIGIAKWPLLKNINKKFSVSNERDLTCEHCCDVSISLSMFTNNLFAHDTCISIYRSCHGISVSSECSSTIRFIKCILFIDGCS